MFINRQHLIIYKYIKTKQTRQIYVHLYNCKLALQYSGDDIFPLCELMYWDFDIAPNIDKFTILKSLETQKRLIYLITN